MFVSTAGVLVQRTQFIICKSINTVVKQYLKHKAVKIKKNIFLLLLIEILFTIVKYSCWSPCLLNIKVFLYSLFSIIELFHTYWCSLQFSSPRYYASQQYLYKQFVNQNICLTVFTLFKTWFLRKYVFVFEMLLIICSIWQ